MIKTFVSFVVLAFAISAFTSCVAAGTPSKLSSFTGTDINGKYTCMGHDLHDGNFKAMLTVTLDKSQSHGNDAGYTFRSNDGALGLYTGTLAVHDSIIAVSFANQDTSKKDFGTAVGKLSRKEKKLQFSLFYYEPEYMGGSYGHETCIQQ